MSPRHAVRRRRGRLWWTVAGGNVVLGVAVLVAIVGSTAPEVAPEGTNSAAVATTGAAPGGAVAQAWTRSGIGEGWATAPSGGDDVAEESSEAEASRRPAAPSSGRSQSAATPGPVATPSQPITSGGTPAPVAPPNQPVPVGPPIQSAPDPVPVPGEDGGTPTLPTTPDPVPPTSSEDTADPTETTEPEPTTEVPPPTTEDTDVPADTENP